MLFILRVGQTVFLMVTVTPIPFIGSSRQRSGIYGGVMVDGSPDYANEMIKTKADNQTRRNRYMSDASELSDTT